MVYNLVFSVYFRTGFDLAEIKPKENNLQAIRMRTADAVISEGLVFQQPLTPAMKETAMKKNPTINMAIIARPMSET